MHFDLNVIVIESDSLLFAPSTIAISALLLSFIERGVDCTAWLRNVPDVCLPGPTNRLFRCDSFDDKHRFLDVDKCIQCFQSIIADRHARNQVVELASDDCEAELIYANGQTGSLVSCNRGEVSFGRRRPWFSIRMHRSQKCPPLMRVTLL